MTIETNVINPFEIKVHDLVKCPNDEFASAVVDIFLLQRNLDPNFITNMILESMRVFIAESAFTIISLSGSLREERWLVVDKYQQGTEWFADIKAHEYRSYFNNPKDVIFAVPVRYLSKVK
jgi:hypothetical protein